MSDAASETILKEYMQDVFRQLGDHPEYYLVIMELVTYISSNEAKRLIYAEQLEDIIQMAQELIVQKEYFSLPPQFFTCL